MSALRWNPPGQPVVLIDLGPARGRATASNGSMGGAIEPIKRSVTVVRNRVKAYQPRPVEVTRCGAWMPNAREYCARRAGHVDSCKTRASVELDNRRRRARDFA